MRKCSVIVTIPIFLILLMSTGGMFLKRIPKHHQKTPTKQALVLTPESLNRFRTIDRASRASSDLVAAFVSTSTTSSIPTTTTSFQSQTYTRKSYPTTTIVRSTEKPTGDIWSRLAYCESTMRQRAVSPDGKYFGYFQFSLQTWKSLGGPGNPIDYDYDTQLRFAKILQARAGWGQWPACSKKLGLF